MVIIMGQGNYGKIDVTPKVGYVTTRFFHLYYVPLIPLGSYIVVDGSESGETFDGVPTRLRWKSVLAAWVRTALVLSLVAGAAVGVVGVVDHFGGRQLPTAETLVVPWILAVASALGWWLTYRSSRASHAQALTIGEALGVPPDIVERRIGIVLDEPMPAATAENDRAPDWK